MYQVEYFLALRVREAGCLCSLYCQGRCLLTNPRLERHISYRRLVDLSFLLTRGLDGDIFLFGVPRAYAPGASGPFPFGCKALR
jgi:hypothetical protein